MVVGNRNCDRDKMAVELYFSVLRIKKAKGYTHKEAKAMAYDAVELRYNISPKRLQNIISNNHDVLNCDRMIFLDENERLMTALREANSDMQGFIDRNNELLKVLEEVTYV
jgi:inorganic pyrophosphatase/exopolyphosphatase